MHISAAQAMQNPEFSNLVNEMKQDQAKLAEAIRKEGTPDADSTSSDQN